MLLVERLLVYSRAGWDGEKGCSNTDYHSKTEQIRPNNNSKEEEDNTKANDKAHGKAEEYNAKIDENDGRKVVYDTTAVCPNKPVITAETIGRIGK